MASAVQALAKTFLVCSSNNEMLSNYTPSFGLGALTQHGPLMSMPITLEDLGMSHDLQPVHWDALQRMFGPNLVDPSSTAWWIDAEQCRENPSLQSCTNKAICTNLNWSAFIDCNDKYQIFEIYVTGQCEFCLSGTLSLHSLPSSVKSMYIEDQYIDRVEFDGLSYGKALEFLSLDSNQITNIDFRALLESRLRRLYVRFNNIQNISFSGLEHSPLEDLNLIGNPIRYIDFRGINKTKRGVKEGIVLGNEWYPLSQLVFVDNIEELGPADWDIFSGQLVDLDFLEDVIARRSRNNYLWHRYPVSSLLLH